MTPATTSRPNIETSPYLHTWSLGVEEQFYLLWPVLVAIGCLLTRRRPAALRRVLVGGFGALFVVSFVLCLLWSADGSSWAFFSLPTRAWEFAAAGLLVALPSPRLGSAARTALAVIGIVVLAVATYALDGIVGYPGAYTLAPVGATLLLLVAGTAAEGQSAAPLSQVLAWRPLQWLGRVSYSWYLWHWPFIVLFASAMDDDRVRVRTIAVLVALPVATLAHHFVESPVRFSRALTTSLPRTFAVGGLVTLLALAGAFGVARYSDWRASRDWLDEQLASARADLSRYACPNEQRSTSGIEYCSVGDPNAATTIMLVGDSHARQWTASLSEVAADLDARLVTRWRGACPATLVELVPRGNVDDDQGCTDYRRDTMRLMDELHPAIVLVAQSDNYQAFIDVPDEGEVAQARADAWGASYGQLLDRVEANGARPAVILDNPGLPRDPVDCISRRRHTESCTPSRADAIRGIASLQRAERAQLATRPDVPVFDPTEVLCDDSTCAVEKNGVLVYSDTTHLTSAFTMTQKSRLAAVLRAAWPP